MKENETKTKDRKCTKHNKLEIKKGRKISRTSQSIANQGDLAPWNTSKIENDLVELIVLKFGSGYNWTGKQRWGKIKLIGKN